MTSFTRSCLLAEGFRESNQDRCGVTCGRGRRTCRRRAGVRVGKAGMLAALTCPAAVARLANRERTKPGKHNRIDRLIKVRA